MLQVSMLMCLKSSRRSYNTEALHKNIHLINFLEGSLITQ